jgi:hypothetical protein
MARRKLYYEDLSELTGATVESLRRQKLRGALPDPDGHDGRRPFWFASTARTWVKNRPGRGRPKKAVDRP